ncbi:MAG: F420H(2):quinone oxidoreductase [Archaeoglobus sp.]|nr:F420H(2):quinone oxidoreductase [Archaeoglobus sp.]
MIDPVIDVATILITSVSILMIAYLMAISSKDLIRLLISLELMFASVFLALLPLFSIESLINESLGIAVITVFTSSSELLVLIATIVKLDKLKEDITTSSIFAGGEGL